MEPVDEISIDWDYIDQEELAVVYNLMGIRESTDIGILSKTKFRDRPKSAGELMKQPKGFVERILIKKSVSLCNIEEFFSKRRIPLIKPLISEKQILKLQQLHQQCKKKQIESENKSISQKLDLEDTDLRSEDERVKDKTRQIATPLLDSKVKRKDELEKIKKEDDKDAEKRVKTPASGMNTSEEAKKKGEFKGTTKKEKNKIGKKEKQEIKTETDKSEQSKSKFDKPPKNVLKTKDQKKQLESKDKDKTLKSEENIFEKKIKQKESVEDDTLKKQKSQTSKQKIESVSSRKESLRTGVSGHSKDEISTGGKSKKSEKTKTKSKIMSRSVIKERQENDEENEDNTMKEQMNKLKSPFEDLEKSEASEGLSTKTEPSKVSKNTKPGKTSKRTSDVSPKDKSQKHSDGRKKSVKFPQVIQHIIHYVLSNPLFIKLGWTLEPSDQTQMQVVTFLALPATPHTYCFRERTEEEIKFYSKSLEKVAYHFRTDGTGEIFYPSGVPAVIITRHNTGMRLTLYSDPQNDPLVSDSFNSKVLGIFDSSGNGVIYDMQGSTVLNFNQLEGILSPPLRSSPYKWQWCDYKTLDKQRSKALLRYMAKDQKQQPPARKPPTPIGGTLKKEKIEEKKSQIDEMYEELLAEMPYPVVQQSKAKGENHFWGFKPITLKINSEMTLRINGQNNVEVRFSSNKIFYRLDLGVRIDPDTVERIEELSSERPTDVACVFNSLLNLSPSLVKLKKQLSHIS